MAAAGTMTLLCHWLRQPVVIGYLLAGLIIGPYTPPFPLITDLTSIHTMAELGLVFLLFSLGLEFNLPKIKRVGLSAGLAAVLEVGGMLVIGYFLGKAFGWNKTDCIFLGAILCISSTTIIVKVFMDFKMMQEKFAQVVFGILILEDIVAVAILSILSGLGSGGPDPKMILAAFLRIGLFVTLFLVLGLLLVPRFIQWVARYNVKEMLGVVTLGLCLSGALLASSFQLSVALGAFLSGAVLAASKEINQIEEWIHPVRDMFSAIFFVSAGMLIQPSLLWTYKFQILAITAVTLVGKVLSGTVGSFAAGYDIKTSARVGMSMAQIGEFSFVIASLGITLKVTSDFLYPLAVTVSSLTTLATPYLIRNSDRVVDFVLLRLSPSSREMLDRYHVRRDVSGKLSSASHGSAIFSSYLVRLGIYIALLIGLVVVAQSLSITFASPFVLGLVWFGTALFCWVLFLAISKYINHVILLSVTKNKWILQRLNIHLFYNTLHTLTLAVLSFLLLITALHSWSNITHVLGIISIAFLLSLFFRRKMNRSKELVENVLDHIIGLASSEPTRQAVLHAGDPALRLFDITDQITLPASFGAKTLREFRLRERSGASVVAIYREGHHIANPSPDLELQEHDVLVLLGGKDELAAAKTILLS
jgi:monovalent cation:H+ antiporter-2, CPA2 family